MSAGIDTAHRVLAHHSKSFNFAAQLLPAECRNDTAVVYAWCRHCDDSVDSTQKSEQLTRLEELRYVLDSVYKGESQSDPVMTAFQQVVQRWNIPQAYPRELLAGMEMDATDVRYATIDDLLLYCFRVAGTVGLMMCHVLGLRDAAALRNAAHLGIGMQLTNICRDVIEDWGLGRLYLPAAMLTDAQMAAEVAGTPGVGCTPDERLRPVFARAIRRLLGLADRFYRSGDAGLSALSPRCSLAVRAARLIYAAIGTRIREQGCDPFVGRVHTPVSQKLQLLLQAVQSELAMAPRLFKYSFRRVLLPEVAFPDDVLPLTNDC
jgi:15-cis-phytoene synthase